MLTKLQIHCIPLRDATSKICLSAALSWPRHISSVRGLIALRRLPQTAFLEIGRGLTRGHPRLSFPARPLAATKLEDSAISIQRSAPLPRLRRYELSQKRFSGTYVDPRSDILRRTCHETARSDSARAIGGARKGKPRQSRMRRVASGGWMAARSCGIGSWGGQRPSLGAHVSGGKTTAGLTPPERANVSYALGARPVISAHRAIDGTADQRGARVLSPPHGRRIGVRAAFLA
jgi:hypothetical protein